MPNDYDIREKLRRAMKTDDVAEFETAARAMLGYVLERKGKYGLEFIDSLNQAMKSPAPKVRASAMSLIAEHHQLAPDEAWRGPHWLASEDDLPLRERWAAVDLLKILHPENYAIAIQAIPELMDRDRDPDRPPPDIDQMKRDLVARQGREMMWYPLLALIILGGILGAWWIRDTQWFWPSIVGGAATVILFVIWIFIKVRRCPACKRWFARGPLTSVGGGRLSESRPVGGISTGSSPVQVRQRYATFYLTTCKHCRHEWMVAK